MRVNELDNDDDALAFQLRVVAAGHALEAYLQSMRLVKAASVAVMRDDEAGAAIYEKLTGAHRQRLEGVIKISAESTIPR